MLPRFYNRQLSEDEEDYFIGKVVEVVCGVATRSRWLIDIDKELGELSSLSLIGYVELERASDVLYVVWDLWKHQLVKKEGQAKVQV